MENCSKNMKWNESVYWLSEQEGKARGGSLGDKRLMLHHTRSLRNARERDMKTPQVPERGRPHGVSNSLYTLLIPFDILPCVPRRRSLQ